MGLIWLWGGRGAGGQGVGGGGRGGGGGGGGQKSEPQGVRRVLVGSGGRGGSFPRKSKCGLGEIVSLLHAVQSVQM